MPPEQVTLPREVRDYFSAIGKRGGASGRRELTRQQAKFFGGNPRGKAGRQASWQATTQVHRQATGTPAQAKH